MNASHRQRLNDNSIHTRTQHITFLLTALFNSIDAPSFGCLYFISIHIAMNAILLDTRFCAARTKVICMFIPYILLSQANTIWLLFKTMKIYECLFIFASVERIEDLRIAATNSLKCKREELIQVIATAN